MASSASSTNALLSIDGQEKTANDKAPFKDAGGPLNTDPPIKIGSTADYANLKFDTQAGVKPETTIRPNAVTPSEPPKEEEEDITAKAPALTTATPASKPESGLKPQPSGTVKESKEEDNGVDLDLDDLHDDNVDLIDLPESTEGDEDHAEPDGDENGGPGDGDEDDEPKFRNEAHAREVFAQLKSLFEAEDQTDGKRDDDKEEIPTGDDAAPKAVAEGLLDDEDGDDKEDKIEEAVISPDPGAPETAGTMQTEEAEPKTFKLKLKFSEGKKLFEGNTVLSEEDVRQSRALFESAVRTVATDIAKQLQEAYQERYVAAKQRNEERTTKRVDAYLTYVVENWVKENKVALKSQLRAKLAENFIGGLKKLFNENYIEVPQSKVNVVTALSRSVKELKSQLHEAEEAKVALHTEMKEAVARERKALVTEHKTRLIAEAAVVLPASDRGAFVERAKSIEFVASKDFRKDLIALREQYVAADKSGTERPINVPVAAPLFEENKDRTPVDNYADALSKLTR